MRAQRPGESTLLLLDAIDSLARSNVAYAVVGAMAASVHGAVRASMDADAILAVHSDELAALDAADPIGVEDFIAMKLFAHGPQHLADARSALDAALRAC